MTSEVLPNGLNDEKPLFVDGTREKESDLDQMTRLVNQLRDDEIEVLWDLLCDLPVKAIAVKRNISKRTVQFRKKRLLKFFGCKSMLELAAYFASRGVAGDFSQDFFCRFRSMRRQRVG